jgi:hypothetical protein
MKVFFKKHLGEIAGSLLVLAIVVIPVFSFAKDGTTLYVNSAASGAQNGSSSHPFKTIGAALGAAKSGDKVNVASGTYKENITLPKKVKLVGAGKGKSVIVSDKNDESVVTMKDGSRIEGVSVRKGRVGIVVKDGAKAEIVNALVEDNRHEGVIALKADVNDDGKLSISNTEIRDNGWSGVYSEKRKLVILDSDIKSNDRSGVALAKGVKAYLDNNSVSNNRESGLSIVLDGSNVSVVGGNTFRNNRLDGIAIVSNGGSGSVIVKKSRLSENDHYGVSKTAKNGASASVWKGVSLEEGNNYFGNTNGNISPIFKK